MRFEDVSSVKQISPELWSNAEGVTGTFEFLMPIFLVISYFLITSYVIFGQDQPGSHLWFFADDLFYYIELARNVLAGKGMTFDEITITNGVQPLWFLVIAGIGSIFKFESIAFFVVLYAIICIITVGSTCYFWKLVRILQWPKEIIILSVASYGLSCSYMSAYGMEACLSLLLIPIFTIKAVTSDELNISLGFMVSLVILSRLDAIILVASICAYILITNYVLERRSAKTLIVDCLYFSIGLSPFILYLLGNLLFFGNLMPDSGVAKGLYLDLKLNPVAFSWLTSPERGTIFFSFGFYLIIASALMLPFVRNTRSRAISASVILACIVYYLQTALRSPWPIWSWYYYMVAFAFPFSLYVLYDCSSRWISERILLPVITLGLVATATFFIGGATWRAAAWGPDKAPIAITGELIAKYSAEHPGIYGMGDRAGLTGYLNDQAIVQLEGLVAGKQMIDFIRSDTDLLDVLRFYGVTYYIGTNLKKDAEGCWLAVEPAMPPSNVHRMRSSICTEPDVHFGVENFDTVIFRVAQ
jgi:hypothetical protein